MLGERIGGAGLPARVLGALARVYGSYNPEGVSFFHWAILPLVRGLSWSSASRRLPGQMDPDEVG